jgi:hypothetical protein
MRWRKSAPPALAGAGQSLSCGRKHISRNVDADDIGVGKSGAKQFGAVAGTTSKIEDAARGRFRDMRQKIVRSACAFALEFKIKF